MLQEEEDTVSSFLAMEEEIESGFKTEALDDPILPCVEPSVELTLLTADDEPAAHAKYSLTLPGGEVRSGVLDENGHVLIEGLDVPADKVKLQVEVYDNDDDPESIPEFTIQLVPIGPEPEESDSSEEEELEAPYFHPTFDHRVVPVPDLEEYWDEDEASPSDD